VRRKTVKRVVIGIGLLVMLASGGLLKLADEQYSLFLGIAGFVVFGLGLLALAWAGSPEVPITNAERKKRFAVLFGFFSGVNKIRQSLVVLAWFTFILGGPLLAIMTLRTYPPAADKVFYVLIGFVPILFIIFLISKYFKSSGPIHFPTLMWIMICLGMAMVTVFAFGGLLLWYNGAMDRTVEVLRAPVVKMSASTRRGDLDTIYVQSWHDANRWMPLHVNPIVYQAIQPGTSVYVTVGKGAANIEWIRAIDLKEPSGVPLSREE
jgi:hypothetical protein